MIKLVLMHEGKVEYTFDTEIVAPQKKEVITIIDINDEYIHYTVTDIQHFFDRFGEFKYLMITAINKN
jgi:hypothetical protein